MNTPRADLYQPERDCERVGDVHHFEFLPRKPDLQVRICLHCFRCDVRAVGEEWPAPLPIDDSWDLPEL